jgi:AcrR family transcriptional regulator
MATLQARNTAARRRILETASTLFYSEGLHSVGIDRIIAEAEVAKATFYNHFPSKDELVRAYVELWSGRTADVVDDLYKEHTSPREIVLAILGMLGPIGREPNYRGCAFINAAAEYPDPSHPAREAVAAHRRWFRATLHDLLVEDDHPDPERTADILVVLRDGIAVGCDLDDPAVTSALIREAAVRILDGSAGPGA